MKNGAHWAVRELQKLQLVASGKYANMFAPGISMSNR